MIPPQPPVVRSTKLGTLPAAIFSCSGWPLIAVPSMNWLCVHKDATVGISFMAMFAGGLVPNTAISAIAGLSPPLLSVAGVPPFAITYRDVSLARSAPPAILKRPSSPVRTSANCAGSPALAAHNVTAELAIGAPPLRTWPLKVTAGDRDTDEVDEPGVSSVAPVVLSDG